MSNEGIVSHNPSATDGEVAGIQPGETHAVAPEGTAPPVVPAVVAGTRPADQRDLLDRQFREAAAANQPDTDAAKAAEAARNAENSGHDEVGNLVPKGSADDVTSKPTEERYANAAANVKLGIDTLRSHGASNIPGSLMYEAIKPLELAYVELTALKNGE